MSNAVAPGTPILAAALRGLLRRCPRCGEGPLFEGWNRLRDNCASCGLRILNDRGDPWVFLLFLDRGAFVLPPIALIYFDLLPESTALVGLVFATLIAVIVLGTPNRYGLCVGLDYKTREWSGAVRIDDVPEAS